MADHQEAGGESRAAGRALGGDLASGTGRNGAPDGTSVSVLAHRRNSTSITAGLALPPASFTACRHGTEGPDRWRQGASSISAERRKEGMLVRSN